MCTQRWSNRLSIVVIQIFAPLFTLFSQNCPPGCEQDCCNTLPNLIANGSFDIAAPIPGVNTYVPNATAGNFHPGDYTILNPLQAHSVLCTHWFNCAPHMGPDKILLVNGRTGQTSPPRVVWTQTVGNLKPDSVEYKFCATFKNIPQCCFDVKPRITVKISPTVVPVSITEIIDLPDPLEPNSGIGSNLPCFKKCVTARFIVAGSTSITITITLDESGEGDGNDLAIGNIALHELPQIPIAMVTPSITATPTGGDTYTISAAYPAFPGGVSPNTAPACCGYYWQVCELSSSGTDCLPVTQVTNPAAWWSWPTACTFSGYVGTTTLAGGAPGKFQRDKRYMVTYGAWCACHTANYSSWIIQLVARAAAPTITRQMRGRAVDVLRETAAARFMSGRTQR